MQALKLDHPVPELQPIGSVSLLGATPTEGDPQVAGAMVYGEPQDAFTCGLFSSTQGSFTMTYPFTEHATVLEGEVELTVSGGEPQRFAPGDSWFVKQGTEVEWKIRPAADRQRQPARRDADRRRPAGGRGDDLRRAAGCLYLRTVFVH